MPLYIDVHSGMHGVTPEDVAAAHSKDLAAQGEHKVRFIKYWADPEQGKVFCLSEAPDADATLAVHAKTGSPTKEIYEVFEGE